MPGGHRLTRLNRRDTDVQTVWQLEHLLSDVEDVKAYLSLPEPTSDGVDPSGVLAEEAALGDAGIVSIEMGDPLCLIAGLLSTVPLRNRRNRVLPLGKCTPRKRPRLSPN